MPASNFWSSSVSTSWLFWSLIILSCVIANTLARPPLGDAFDYEARLPLSARRLQAAVEAAYDTPIIVNPKRSDAWGFVINDNFGPGAEVMGNPLFKGLRG